MLTTLLFTLITAELPPPDGLGRLAVIAVDHSRAITLVEGFCNLYNLHILREEDGSYTGFLFGWAVTPCNPGYDGCDAIYLARGDALTGPWEVYAGEAGWNADRPDTWLPVVTAGDQPWDQWHNGDPTVVRVGGMYYLAYSATGDNLDGIAYGRPGDTDGSILCVMGATSADGITWHKSPNPILIHEPDLGAASTPEGDAHLYGSYHRPSLLYEDGIWRLWFDYWAGAAKGVSVGYAECLGAFLEPSDWTVLHAGESPVLPQFPNPDVVRVGDLLLAFGDPPVGRTGHGWIDRKITVAASLDGVDWLVIGHLDPPEGVPAIHVPEVIVDDGQLWLCYATQRGGEPYDYMYDSIRLVPVELDLAAIAAALPR